MIREILRDHQHLATFLDWYISFTVAVIYGSGRRTAAIWRMFYGLIWPVTLLFIWPIMALVQNPNPPDEDEGALPMRYIWTIEGAWFFLIIDWKIGSVPNFVKFFLVDYPGEVTKVSWILVGLVLFAGTVLGWAVRLSDPKARQFSFWQKIGMAVVMPVSYLYWIWEGRGLRFVFASLPLWVFVLADWKLGGSGDTVRTISAYK